MSRNTLFLNDALYKYMLAATSQEPAILTELRAETARLPHADMQIAPEQGQFMALLIRLMGAKKALEIGTFTGYSSLVVALSLPKEGKLICCDVSKEWTDIAQNFWIKAGVQSKITLHLAPALETLDKLIDMGEMETFDFIFIDADKGNYINYFEKALLLLRTGGLIAIDNTFMDGRVIKPGIKDVPGNVISELNKKLSQDNRVTVSLIPFGDGLTLALKN